MHAVSRTVVLLLLLLVLVLVLLCGYRCGVGVSVVVGVVVGVVFGSGVLLCWCVVVCARAGVYCTPAVM